MIRQFAVRIMNEKACQAVTVRINSFRSDNRQGQRVSARHICDMCGGPLSTPRQAWCKEVLACGSNVFFSGAPPCADHAHEVVTRGSKATRSFPFLTANSGAPGRGSPMPTPVARALETFRQEVLLKRPLFDFVTKRRESTRNS